MPSAADYVIGAAGSYDSNRQNTEARQAKEADRNRQLHPEIQQMIQQYGPKRAAIMLKLQQQQGAETQIAQAPQGPTESVYQGMAPGSEGGLSSMAQVIASRQPTGFREDAPQSRLQQTSAAPSPRGLGAMAAAPQPSPEAGTSRPWTTRDVEDLERVTPYIKTQNLPERETPEQRSERERRNIELRGDQSRTTEGVKQGGRVEVEGKKGERSEAQVAGAMERTKVQVQGAWDRVQAQLAQLHRESTSRGVGSLASSRLRVAQQDVDSLRSTLKGLRTSMPEMAGDPEVMRLANETEQKLGEAESFLENMWDQHDAAGVKSSIRKSSSTRTPNGMIQPQSGTPPTADDVLRRLRGG